EFRRVLFRSQHSGLGTPGGCCCRARWFAAGHGRRLQLHLANQLRRQVTETNAVLTRLVRRERVAVRCRERWLGPALSSRTARICRMHSTGLNPPVAKKLLWWRPDGCGSTGPVFAIPPSGPILPGHLFTREELKQGIWGRDTFVDFENGLNPLAGCSGCSSPERKPQSHNS